MTAASPRPAAPAERQRRGAPLTSTHQRLLDLADQLDALGFEWGCCGSLLDWLRFSYEAGAVDELDEHEALEAGNHLEAAIKSLMLAAPPAGHPAPPRAVPQPPGSGA